MVCARKGYPLVVTMAENFSIERRKILRFLGAKVVLTPGSARGTGMLAKAVELAQTHGWFLCKQFENEANPDMHSRTTAQEILRDFEGERLDYWVTGFGTGGTLKGVARILKEQRPDTKIVVCEPDNARLLASGLGQSSKADGSPDGSHPSFNPHVMQGWSPDFIPKLTQDAVTAKLIDALLPIDGGDAFRMSRDLAQKEGIFAGISAGATLAGALQICESAARGSTVLCMLPDTGERYLTTPLFEDIAIEMTEEEAEISRSSPSYRFDVCATSRTGSQPVEVTAEAKDFVAAAIVDARQRVVMFALEWCEFCWSVRRFFDKAEIPYQVIALDSIEYAPDKRGEKIRAALTTRTSVETIPQIFIGGDFVGGCTEVFDAFKDGNLQQKMKAAGIGHNESFSTDPYTFMPTWLHPR